MQKVAAVIVDRKTLFFLLFAVLAVFCVFSRNWVNVNDDITSYLAKDTETRRGLDIMESEFTTFATANVMVSSITYEAAEKLLPRLEAVDGVHSVEFDATEDHYKNASALFAVTFDGDTTSAVSEAAMDEIKSLLSGYDCYISSEVGNPLEQTIKSEMVVVLGIAIFIIVAVLLFTFKSVGLPILLIIVIQSSIWINFSVPYLTSSNLFFISYLIVSAIQMGANIDYAIVISSRYFDLKKSMPIKEAMVETLNQAFPTIITSGAMLASAGLIIGRMTSDNTISSIGTCLGRGTIISIFLVMGVLPQILLLGDLLIEKTAFAIKGPEITHVEGSTIRLHGRVRGQISGFIDADVRGVFQGSLHAMVESGTIEVDETRPELPPSEELAGDGDESETGEEKGDDI